MVRNSIILENVTLYEVFLINLFIICTNYVFKYNRNVKHNQNKGADLKCDLVEQQVWRLIKLYVS